MRHPFLIILGGLCLAAIGFGQAGENATLPLPPNPPPPGNNIPDLNGVWQAPFYMDLARPFGGPPPMTPLGKDKFDSHLGGDDPHGFCQPMGPTRNLHSIFPFQIVQSAGMLTILFEADHTFRRIFTDGRGHPQDQDITWYGDSIGHYDGNSLIVETVGLTDRSWLDTAGHQHSDKLKIVENITKTDDNNISWKVTFDDPVYYSKPWTVTLPTKRQKYDIMEMICTDNNQDTPHYITSKPKP